MVWMLQVNGFMVDVRHAPREMQEIAFNKGLIPYIPADRQERGWTMAIRCGHEKGPLRATSPLGRSSV